MLPRPLHRAPNLHPNHKLNATRFQENSVCCVEGQRSIPNGASNCVLKAQGFWIPLPKSSPRVDTRYWEQCLRATRPDTILGKLPEAGAYVEALSKPAPCSQAYQAAVPSRFSNLPDLEEEAIDSRTLVERLQSPKSARRNIEDSIWRGWWSFKGPR